jgi:RNA 2',3'-cyclic 3'-phosphodiesterase
MNTKSVTAEAVHRLFCALWPNNELRHQLEHETRSASHHSGGRVIPARNLHLTLAFLGEVAHSRIVDAQTAIAEVAISPVTLRLGRIQWWQRQELLCLEPEALGEGVVELNDLAHRLHKSLRAHGFVLESRPFRAHVTLAREVRRDHPIKPIRLITWPVDRIELVESQVGERGSVYTLLPR